MADPNTQIDWWIAQAWQEAQGGAESDDLVVWLHGNGLTAVSSYTILQAALGCEPQEAKDIVFGHPVWADEATDLDVANLDYTSDTLEPEPEPDPAFELDDWAEQLEEEGPVYGEEGYQPTPVTAEPDEALTSEKAFAPAGDFDDEGGFDNESGFDEELGAALVSDAGSSPMVDDVPSLDQPVESPAEFTPAFDPESPVATHDTMAPTAEVLSPDAEAEYEPASVMDGPVTPPEVQQPVAPARPPVLRTPPSTPAERAAVFAGAFGKKRDAAAQEPVDESPAAKVPPLTSDAGPTGEAETSPAHAESKHPHPAQAEASMPPPLVFEPLPEIELAPPVAPVEPLFTAAPTPKPAPSLEFSPSAPSPSISDPVVAESPERPSPDAGGELEDLPDPDDVEAYGEPEPAAVLNELDASLDERHEPFLDEDDVDLPPGMLAAMVQSDVEPAVAIERPEAEPGDFSTAMDREQQPLSAGEIENEDQEPHIALFSDDFGEGEDVEPGFDEGESAMSGSGKRALLSSSDDGDEDGILPIDLDMLPKGDTPEELAAAAKLLGISFRDSDPAEVGVDPDMAKTAKELGISFREDADESDAVLDEMALEAQRLGISFREDGGPSTGSLQKPMIVRYLPLFLGVVAIFFLLLLGATFAQDIIVWFWS